MPWGNVAFDADLAAYSLGDLGGAPALHAGDVELGKSAGGHAVMIAAENRTGYARRQLLRFRLGSAEHFGWGCPAEYSTRAVVEFRGDDVELVLGERGQVGVLVQVLAQQPVRVLVGTALPWVVAMGGAGRRRTPASTVP
jgi:hypothetical protein